MKINLLSAALFAFGASLLLSSCFKRDNADWTFTQDNSVSSELFQDVYKQVDETAQSDGNLKSCANVTLSDTLGNFPNAVTIDYDSACLGSDGRLRSGSIQAVFTGRWRDAGTTVTIDLQNYSVNDYAIEASVTVTNNGRNTAGNMSYSVEVDNGQIIDPDGNTISWEGTTTYEWTEGESTTFFSDGLAGIRDDVYNITGNSSGINRNGSAYTSEITEPLIRRLNCKWITTGEIELTPNNGDPRVINFGNGDCDAAVTFSFNGISFNFLLP